MCVRVLDVFWFLSRPKKTSDPLSGALEEQRVLLISELSSHSKMTVMIILRQVLM